MVSTPANWGTLHVESSRADMGYLSPPSELAAHQRPVPQHIADELGSTIQLFLVVPDFDSVHDLSYGDRHEEHDEYKVRRALRKNHRLRGLSDGLR